MKTVQQNAKIKTAQLREIYRDKELSSEHIFAWSKWGTSLLQTGPSQIIVKRTYKAYALMR